MECMYVFEVHSLPGEGSGGGGGGGGRVIVSTSYV